MKNFILKGDKLAVTAPCDVESGDLVIVGDLVGVAIIDGKKGEEITISCSGVYEFEKMEEEKISQGQKAYYNPEQKKLTTLAQENDSTLTCVGLFVQNVKATEKKVQVKLA